MRPLAWSVPVWELPVGMYSLRERLEILTDPDAGLLLTRPVLGAMVAGDAWSTVWAEPAGRTLDLWLSGRLGARWEILEGLLAAAEAGESFAWFDGDSLIAACLDPETSGRVHDSWQIWLGASDAGLWRQDRPVPPWQVASLFRPWVPVAESGAHRLLVPGGDRREDPGGLADRWRSWAGMAHGVLDAIWDLVPAAEGAVAADIGRTAGQPLARNPFGLVADQREPIWEKRGAPSNPGGGVPTGVTLLGDPQDLYLGAGVVLEPGTVIDATSGPVLLDSMVHVQSSCRLAGPLYLGRGCLVKAGARLYPGCSAGIGCRLAGEIGETVLMNFVNKQHDGFLGHAVLGSWINLGAMTTCSDLKNNYGQVRVDLGWGPLETGSRFVGLLAGDHVKTAIGTLLNTGTSIGFATNIFGSGMPAKHVPCFAWGGVQDTAVHDLAKAEATARVVMGRRGCRMTPQHEALFRKIASGVGRSV